MRLALMIWLAVLNAGIAGEVRTWLDASGSHSVDASLVKCTEGLVTLQKKDGKTISVPLSSLRESDRRYAQWDATPEEERPTFGLSLKTYSENSTEITNLFDNLGIEEPPTKSGLLVESVSLGSPAQAGGFHALDIIYRIERNPVATVAEFNEWLKTLAPRNGYMFHVLRVSDRKVRGKQTWNRISGKIEAWTVKDVESAARICPIELRAAIVEKDSIGTPFAVLAVHNRSSHAVEAFKANVRCFDKFDTALREYGSGDFVEPLIFQERILPHKDKDHTLVRIRLRGFKTATRVEVEITRVKLSDASEWVPEGAVEESISAERN